jgi:hypothetical protein
MRRLSAELKAVGRHAAAVAEIIDLKTWAAEHGVPPTGLSPLEHLALAELQDIIVTAQKTGTLDDEARGRFAFYALPVIGEAWELRSVFRAPDEHPDSRQP